MDSGLILIITVIWCLSKIVGTLIELHCIFWNIHFTYVLKPKPFLHQAILLEAQTTRQYHLLLKSAVISLSLSLMYHSPRLSSPTHVFILDDLYIHVKDQVQTHSVAILEFRHSWFLYFFHSLTTTSYLPS